MLVKSSCAHCQATVEFEAEEYKYGMEVACPHCQQPTPVKMNNRRMWYPAPNSRGRSSGLSDNTIGMAYLVSLLVPLAGFFFGIYLMAKKEPGHGAACMGLSVFVAIVVWALILN